MTARHGPSRRQSFQDFYLRNVAISEGCGCAELVIRREHGDTVARGHGGGWLAQVLRRLIAIFRRRNTLPKRDGAS